MFRISWLDREALIRKVEKMQKENMILQHRVDEVTHKKDEEVKEVPPALVNYQVSVTNP